MSEVHVEANDLTPSMSHDTHQFLENNVSFWALPSRRKALYEIELKNKAAIKIQSVWRGYQARQIFKAAYISHKRETAAITLQTAVRRWLYEKRKMNKIIGNITEEEHVKINEKIKMWRKNKELLIDIKQFEKTHKDVQEQLGLWYSQAPARELHRKRLESLCAKLEATSIILEGSRDLDVLNRDASFYQCSSIPLAIEARLNHKQQIKALNAKWWEKLTVQEQMT